MEIFNKSFYQNVCTDSRRYNGEAYFFAIPGSNFNALKHIEEIVKTQTLEFVIYQKNNENDELVKKLSTFNNKIIFHGADDFFKTFGECANLHRTRWGEKKENTLIAISGSNGKTTNKEMIYHILSGLYPNQVIKTKANNNNHIGVPLTLFDIKEDTRFAIVELGSNAPGEIEHLCKISNPDCAVSTNIGFTHMEFFKTLDDVFIEESKPYEYISNKENSFFLINKLDPYLKNLKIRKRDLTIGVSGCDFEVNVSSSSIGFVKPFKVLIQNEKLLGKHNFINLGMSVAICFQIVPEKKDEIINLAQSFKPNLNRSQWIEYKKTKIFLDAYNANPSSMIAALEAFSEKAQDKSALIVVGDMNELGDYTVDGHRKVGKFIRECGFENVVFIGRYADHYLKEYPFAKKYESYQDFKPSFNQDINNFELVFLKASRTLQLERLVDIN